MGKRFYHGQCYYCDCGFRNFTRRGRNNELPWNAETVDHVYPVTVNIPSGLPRNSLLNKVRSCNRCNQRKANMHPLRWLTFIENPALRDRFGELLISLGESPKLVERAKEVQRNGSTRISEIG